MCEQPIAVRTDIHSVELERGCPRSQERRGLPLKGDRDMISRLKLGCELRSPQCSGSSLAMAVHHSVIHPWQDSGTGHRDIGRAWHSDLENTCDWHGKNDVRERVWKTTA